mmetsp:Transcript_10912/g.31319  ORF Transcript_10912/g.31319 Transcript_10912/m.31319 type:complete len:272 (+) Transcript_10912:452-1267(+)
MGQVLALRVTLCGGRPALRPGCGETSPSPRVRSSGLWGATLWCDGRPIVSLRRIAQPPQRPPPAPAGAVLPSIIAEVPLFQTSISLYEAYCSWGMVTYIAVVAYLGLVVTVVLAHCIYARQRGQLSSWLVESFASIGVAVVPAFRASFHFHHWLLGWIVAVLARHPPWWSELTQALALGVYVNGIAIYGRDPVLGCEAVVFRATSTYCPMVDIITGGSQGGGGGAFPESNSSFAGGGNSSSGSDDAVIVGGDKGGSFDSVNWWNCSSSPYT